MPADARELGDECRTSRTLTGAVARTELYKHLDSADVPWVGGEKQKLLEKTKHPWHGKVEGRGSRQQRASRKAWKVLGRRDSKT